MKGRWEMRRQIAAVAVVLSFVAGNAWGQVQYTVTDLGTLSLGVSGTWSFAYAINDSRKWWDSP